MVINLKKIISILSCTSLSISVLKRYDVENFSAKSTTTTSTSTTSRNCLY